jgi:predicted CoA-substrate-specific enzyme activase
MAHALGYTIDSFGREALKAKASVSISSMCTVFAESEVISLMARGESVINIARGLHESIANRVLTMFGRIVCEDDIIFAGGVAKNPCMAELLRKKLKQEIYVPDEPQIIGALGAALSARNLQEVQ